MKASQNGHLEVVRTLIEGGAFVNAKTYVRNQMMMMMLMMMMMMMMMMIVINDKDRDVCR
jgi:hypothetical protein